MRHKRFECFRELGLAEFVRGVDEDELEELAWGRSQEAGHGVLRDARRHRAPSLLARHPSEQLGVRPQHAGGRLGLLDEHGRGCATAEGLECERTGACVQVEDGDAVDLADAMAQEPASSWLYTSSNVGDGKVYGFEFDVSTPLSAIGLENTGIFANYSWVKSKVDDFLGERRFNDQAKSVYNIGFIHDLPTLGASFGATYRKQGDAYARVLGEEVLIRYGGELDVFVEKRFGTNVSVRLSANNLLDASKDEFFDKFDTLQDQIDRDYDEYELETEEAGPSYQLVLRWAF